VVGGWKPGAGNRGRQDRVADVSGWQGPGRAAVLVARRHPGFTQTTLALGGRDSWPPPARSPLARPGSPFATPIPPQSTPRRRSLGGTRSWWFEVEFALW